MSIADIYGTKPYNIMDAINQGLGTVNNISNTRMGLKYAPKEEEAKYQNMLASLADAQARAKVAPQYYGGRANLVNNQASQSAMETSLMPKKYQLEASSVGSENQLRQAQMALLNAKLQGLAHPDYKPVSSYGKMAQDIQHIKKMYGENSPEYKSAVDSLNSNAAYKNAYAAYLSSPALQERGLSALGKSYAEPGILQKQGIPVDQNSYDRSRQRQTTDQFTRTKAFYGENYKKTVSQIDPAAITAYSGISGAVKLKNDQLESLNGNTKPEYQAYVNMVDEQIPVAVEQMRQYFGGSIQPSEKRNLEYMSNPVNWHTNPQVALAKFNALQKVMDSEIKTTADRLQRPISQSDLENPSVSSGSLPKGSRTYNPETGTFTDAGG